MTAICSSKYSKILLNCCAAFIVACFIFIAHIQLGRSPQHERSLFEGPFNHSFYHRTLRSNRSERKLVLLWTPFFSQTNWLPSTEQLNCTIKECDVTSDRSLLTESSAVVLHLRNVNTADLPPECATSSNANSSEFCPRLVLFNKESPPHTNSETIRKLHRKIHITATYRKDSDIYAPYGVIAKSGKTFDMPDISQKRTSVCWLVSNCQTASSREIYVNELKRHIDVEVYGKCGDNKCPHKDAIDCYRLLSKHCKFYLSFENSICKDYSTEKLYFALMTDMVPIVLGGDDYAKYLPNHSFINVEDFSSPKSLAGYLHELNDDASKYLRYFQWKKKYESVFVPYHWFCDLCHMLHSTTMETVTAYDDLTSWWFGEAHCGSL